jgi:hypothetical protein
MAIRSRRDTARQTTRDSDTHSNANVVGKSGRRTRGSSVSGLLILGMAATFVLYVVLVVQPPVDSIQASFASITGSTTTSSSSSSSTSDQNSDNNSDNDNNDDKPIQVAYAISLIECTDHHKSGQSSVAGLQDGSVVLRHSIHQNSVRNPDSGSKYDYHMYAIVHEQAKDCAPLLEDVGFTTLIRAPPLVESEIVGDELRKKIHREVCCGVDEFVKLYAYQLPHPIVVHLDIDFLFTKPMDALFDIMMGDQTKETRALVDREDPTAPWPETVDAIITRDYHSSGAVGRNSGFQAGFWVLKPSMTHFEALLEIVRKGDYVSGFGRDNGWGGLGYGGFVGAMAMQGLVAYYYDIHVPGTWVELNNCRYNAVSAVVKKKGQCLSGRETCEDCTMTPVDEIHSIHYTACRKPWQCIAMSTKDPANTFTRKYSMPVDIINYDQCMQRLNVWHGMRTDLESKLFRLTGDESIQKAQAGDYNKEFFQGHCTEDQAQGYLRIGGSPETIKRIPELYA